VDVELEVDVSQLHTILPHALAQETGVRNYAHGPAAHCGPGVTMSPANIAPQGLGLRLKNTDQVLEHHRPFGPATLGVRND
jgi:hypothetical protein